MSKLRLILYVFIMGGIFLLNKYTDIFIPPQPQVFAQQVPSSQERNSLRVGPQALDPVNIDLKEPIELDYKTREEVFAIRTQEVNIFSGLLDSGYHPSLNVFGQIVDHKPWWGIEGQFCKGPGNMSIEGPSEENRFFINPYLLLGLDEGKAFWDIAGRPCAPVFPRPVILRWSAQEAKAEVTYDISRFFRERARSPRNFGSYDILELVNYNARDLGFDYIYAVAQRSSNVQPASSSNLFNQAIQMKGFIHLGGSCGYPGGCNNASPYDPDVRIKITELPAVLTCELWKNKPQDLSEKPDFTFILYLN